MRKNNNYALQLRHLQSSSLMSIVDTPENIDQTLIENKTQEEYVHLQ